MDREIASATYDVYLASLSIDGRPARAWNPDRSGKAQQTRLADKKVWFEDLADDSLAKEVAKELGFKQDNKNAAGKLEAPGNRE